MYNSCKEARTVGSIRCLVLLRFMHCAMPYIGTASVSLLGTPVLCIRSVIDEEGAPCHGNRSRNVNRNASRETNN